MMIGSLPSPWLTYLFLENLSRRLRLRCNELFEVHRFLLQPFKQLHPRSARLGIENSGRWKDI